MAAENPAKPKSRKKQILGCLGLVFVLAIACCSYDVFRVSQIERYNAEAMAARDQGDCVRAIELYDLAINSKGLILGDTEIKQAEDGKRVCQEFLEIVAQQEAGQFGDALLAYHDFINQYPDNTLQTMVRDQAQTIFAEAQPESIADEAVCQNLDDLLTNELVPDPDTNLPLFYLGCGQVYFDTGDYSQSVSMWQTFTTDFPSHARLEEVESLLASALIAEARQLGAGTIPPPQSTGSGTGSGPAVIIIQNDSPEEMSLVFSGPETRFETLPACETCEEYGSSGPDYCPEQGPIGTYEIPAGTYDVVVKSISDAGVTPFTGQWEVGNGEEYYSCFFLVTR